MKAEWGEFVKHLQALKKEAWDNMKAVLTDDEFYPLQNRIVTEWMERLRKECSEKDIRKTAAFHIISASSTDAASSPKLDFPGELSGEKLLKDLIAQYSQESANRPESGRKPGGMPPPQKG